MKTYRGYPLITTKNPKPDDSNMAWEAWLADSDFFDLGENHAYGATESEAIANLINSMI